MSPAPAVRVVLVDDQQMVRAGFRMLLESQPDLVVVGEAGDGRAAVARMEDEGRGDVAFFPLDLGTMHSARAAAHAFLKREERLDVLGACVAVGAGMGVLMIV